MSKPTVLLVDDEPSLVKGLRLRLRGRPFNVDIATGPLAALERLAIGPVEAVVSDERMPDMSGSEFLARIAQLSPQTVRVMLTGQASVEAAMRAINEARVDRFLSKPIDANELGDLLEKLLAERQARLARELEQPLTKQTAAELLELAHPGISDVRRDEQGAILLDLDDAA